MRCESHVRICEGLRGQFPRPTRRSIYVKSKRAGERVMESMSTYIEKELKLKVNIEKSMVTRPWRTKLLGFTFYHKKGCKCITYTVKAFLPTRIKSGQLPAAVNLTLWKSD
jgi:hypothetical protein